MNYNITPLFSYPLYKGSSEVSESIISYATISNYADGVLSESILPSGIKDLEQAIVPHVDNYLYNVLKFSKFFNYKFADGWFIKVTPGIGPSNTHTHCNSLFSGVLYLQVPDNSGDIIFSKKIYNNTYSLVIDPPIEEDNLYNTKTWYEKPSKGKILLFPSNLQHGFMKNNSNLTRLSYAFNIVPTGVIDPRAGSALKYD
jgi:uncharacterized protein (TIGR02466 family)